MDIDVEGFNTTYSQVRKVIEHRNSIIQSADHAKQRAEAHMAQPSKPNTRDYAYYKKRTKNLEQVSKLFEEAKKLLTIYNNE